MHLLQATNLSFRYEKEWVVRDVTFSLEPGEFVGLLGPNGSGKSTLLKVLNGVLRPQQGQVTFENREVSSWGRRRLAQGMAMVAQETQADFPFTVLELVLMGRYPHLGALEFEKERDLAIARQCMEHLEIDYLETRLVTQLSGGERQRALVARALCQEPRCLLMDEPTAFLDLRHQLDLFTLTRDLTARHRVGALIILHDINLAAQFCDRLLVMDRGRLPLQGTPEEVVQPEHLEAIYGCRLQVDRSPVSGKPRVAPVSPIPRRETEEYP